MREEFNSIRSGKTQVNPDSECPDLDHVETFNVSAGAQAAADRTYIRFLEAKNAWLEDLCTRAWLSLAALSPNRAQRLLASADKASFRTCSTSQVHRNSHHQ